ncbi:MAG: LysR family transcriptional regulator [Pseudomonadota bacterium]|nr:LysR family transcriptional regulator [Pseudomonadota bacterium]
MVKQVLLSARAMGYAQADKRLEILHLVARHGSISQAARSAGISYKAAWQAIHTLTNLAGEPLVDSSVGGAGGGGARLTAAGQRLLDAAAQMDAARRDVLARFNNGAPGSGELSSGAITGPRTSMRNHLRAIVTGLHSQGMRDPLVRVTLTIEGQGAGDVLASRITRESAELLGLAPGLGLLALCKATAVRVCADATPAATSADAADLNLLHGKVLALSRGSGLDEVTLTLAGGQQLVGFAQRPNRLRAGSRVIAEMDESALVLALAA